MASAGRRSTAVSGFKHSAPEKPPCAINRYDFEAWPPLHAARHGRAGLGALGLPPRRTDDPDALGGDSVASAGGFGGSMFGAGVLGRSDARGHPGVRGEGTTSAGVAGISLDAPAAFGESVNSAGVGGRCHKPELGPLPAVPQAWKAPRAPSAAPALRLGMTGTRPLGERLATAKALAGRGGSGGKTAKRRRPG